MSEVAGIMDRLLQIKEQQDRLAGEANALWKAFYEIADREAGEKQAFRYLNEKTGMVIGRVAATSESIDDEELKAVLSHDQWLAVTIETRMLKEELLEAEMTRGHISKDIVEPCILRATVVRKMGPKKATKEELAEITERNMEEAR